MNPQQRSRNRALLRFVALPMIFLTVALLGGLRIDAETHLFIFVPPPLLTLILAILLVVLFVRGHAIELHKWVNSEQPVLVNISHVLTLLALYFASAQVFNSVLPERGLLFWLFSLFFLWTLWNNLFSNFDARRLLRSLAALFGMAFFMKHIVLASLFSPEPGLVKKIVGFFVNVGTLGTLDFQAFAPATGYISLFTLLLYVGGLLLMTPVPEEEQPGAQIIIRNYQNYPPPDAMFLQREGAMNTQEMTRVHPPSEETRVRVETTEIAGEIVEPKTEERQK